MNFARFTVGRPIFTTMVTLIVVTLGVTALRRLPIDLMPDISYPTMSIVAEYSNTGPEEMETLVTKPIEEAVAVVPGVEEISSESAEGSSQVRLSFSWGTDIDVATNDVRDRLDRIMDNLPEEMDRPEIRKFDVSASPVMILGISSNLDPTRLREFVDDRISDRLERLPGVAAVDIFGGLQREIHVDLNRGKLEALGLSLDQIRNAIQNANVTVPAGEIEHGNLDLSLRTPGEFTSIDQIRNTVVATHEGAPIYLRQIADIIDTHKKQTRLIRINGKPGIRLAIRKQSGSNTVQVAQSVKTELEKLHHDFPQMNIVPIIDSSQYIQSSINNVGQAIVYGGSLAVLVLLFFLRELRSTLVVATAIPISIIGTFMLIYFGGFTLNLMTLGGLALGVGMMVDNAIVVIENINRLRHQQGLNPVAAAVDGTGQVSAAVVASTITTLVIFLPMIFAQGMAGILFRQLGYVIAFALLCSLAVSLTLIPMMASRLVQTDATRRKPSAFLRLEAACSGILAQVEAVYLKLLDRALAHRRATILITLALLAVSLILIPFIGGEFMPKTDESEVRVNVETEPGTRLETLNERMLQVESIVDKSVPEAAASTVMVGSSGGHGNANEGEIRLALVPRSQRSRTSDEIARDLEPRLKRIPGASIRTRPGQGLFIFRRLAGSDTENLEIELRGYNLDTLSEFGKTVRGAIQNISGITDVRLSREQNAPQQVFHIERDRAADLGVSVNDVARTLETAIAGSTTGQYREGGDEFDILVKLKNAERLSIEDILNLTVINNRGEQVVLRNVVSTEPSQVPMEIDRKDQQRVEYVEANVSGRDLNSVVDDVRARLQRIPTPPDTDVIIGGDYEQQQQAFRELVLNLVMAIFLVYMVLACLYESLLDPLIVMGCVPLAVIGVLFTLFLTGTTFNVQSFIGCVMLIGIVVNNAILLVDHAGQLRGEGVTDIMEAVRMAGRHRLRPILMTTLTTILGLLPLALGFGEGGETQAPLARVVSGGLLSSTLITLVITPVLYSLAHGRQPVPEPAAGSVPEAGA